MEFVFVAVGVSIIVRSVGAARGMRDRRLPHYPNAQPQPAQLEDPRVPMLQAEVEELRTQVERLSAAESFYAQLSAPAPQRSAGAVPPATPPPSSSPPGPQGERPAG